MARLKSRIKIIKTPRKSKKASKSPETVDKCDYCFTPLGRLYGRMSGSSAIALGNGLAIAEIGNRWHFYCDSECRENHLAGTDK